MKKCEVCGKEIPEDYQNLLCDEHYSLAEKTRTEPVKSSITNPNYKENPQKEDKEQWLANIGQFQASGVLLWKDTRWMYTFIKNYCMERVQRHPQYPKFIWKPKIVDVGCFPSGTKITMGDFQVKNIEDVRIGERVFTHTQESRRVIKTFKRKFRGNLYKIDAGYGIKINCTEEHPFYIADRKTNGCVEDRKFSCNSNNNGKCSKCGKVFSFKKEFRPAKDVKEGDYLIVPRLETASNNYLSNLSSLLGWYLAEGNVIYSHKPKIAGALFTLDINEDNYAKEICDAVSNLNPTSVRIKKRPDKNIQEVFVYSKDIGELLLRLGGSGSHDKTIHKDVFSWSTDEKITLIKSWLKGDGHYKVEPFNGISYVGKSVSDNLRNDIQRLSFQLGMCPAKTKESVIFSGIDATFLKDTELNRFSGRRYRVDRDNIYLPIKHIEKSKQIYKKTVYNLQVEDDNSYVANNISVHNCGSGVGSNVLSQEADFVWGIDKNAMSVKFAKEAFERVKNGIYYSSQLTYDNIDIMEDNREVMKFDVVVAIEIIEHIADHRGFLERLIKKFDKRDADDPTEYFISTPNRNNKSIQDDHPKNPFHVKEWTSEEFYNVLSEFFGSIEFMNAKGEPIEGYSTTHTPLLARCKYPKI
jgi:intein/homing endonuclease